MAETMSPHLQDQVPGVATHAPVDSRLKEGHNAGEAEEREIDVDLPCRWRVMKSKAKNSARAPLLRRKKGASRLSRWGRERAPIVHAGAKGRPGGRRERLPRRSFSYRGFCEGQKDSLDISRAVFGRRGGLFFVRFPAPKRVPRARPFAAKLF